jgi:hypothetical protein
MRQSRIYLIPKNIDNLFVCEICKKTFEKIVLTIFEKKLLREDGMMVIEHSKYTKMDNLIHFSFKKTYGGSIFSFFEINGNKEEKGLESELSKTNEN